MGGDRLDCGEVRLHGRDAKVPGSAGGSDAEQRAGRLTRARSAMRPLANEAVLLIDAGFVMDSDFDRCLRRKVSETRLQRVFEVFYRPRRSAHLARGGKTSR